MTLFMILGMLVAVLLTLVVLVQNSKGGGLSSTFGANNLSNMIGNRRASQDIEKITWYLIGGLMVIAFLASATISGEPVIESTKFEMWEGIPPAMSAPAATPAPAPVPAP